MNKQSRHEALHYLSVGLLICLCGYLAYQATQPLSLFDAGQISTVTAKELSDHVAQTFKHLNDINFFGFLMLCVSAIMLHIKHHAITPFFVNLISYFVVLCMSYFWVGDLLFVFQRNHELWEGGFSSSIMIVPIKLGIAGFMGYVSYVLAKHIKAQKLATE